MGILGEATGYKGASKCRDHRDGPENLEPAFYYCQSQHLHADAGNVIGKMQGVLSSVLSGLYPAASLILF